MNKPIDTRAFVASNPAAMEKKIHVADEHGKLERKTTVELLEESLRKRILLGELAPGKALRQEALSKEMGVSRIPLREAIRMLSSAGLVDLVPHKGAVVSMISIDEVKEFYDLRIQLEPWLFEQATAQHHDDEFGHLEIILQKMETADAMQWSELNWVFHEHLYRAANRPKAIEIVRALNEKTKRYLCLQVINSPIRDQASREHASLIELYRNHRVSEAKQTMEEHIHGAANQVMEIVARLLHQ